MPALLPNKHPSFAEKTMGKRCKWAISMILSGIASLGGVIIKGLNSYLNHKRNAVISYAVKQLYENDKIFHDRMLVMQNKTALLAKTQLQQVNNIRENIHKFNKKLNQTNWQFYVFMEETETTFWWTYSAINNHHLAINMLAIKIFFFSYH